MEPRIRRRVWVSGRVQGVAFRAAARRQARAAGVGGWVRNLADGRVEAVFEGAPGAVDSMLAWCREGPSHARVERVEVREEPPEGAADFEVR
jgi:acylphosphatase